MAEQPKTPGPAGAESESGESLENVPYLEDESPSPPRKPRRKARKKVSKRRAEDGKKVAEEQPKEKAGESETPPGETTESGDGATPDSPPTEPAAAHDVATLLQVGDLPLTPDARSLLAVAVNLLEAKQRKREVLSTTVPFLAAVEWGRASESSPRPPSGLVALASTVLAEAEQSYESLVASYFGTQRPAVQAELAAPPSALKVSDNLRAVLEGLSGGQEPVSAAMLVRAVLQRVDSPEGSDAVLRSRLEPLGLPISALEAALFPGVSTHAASDLWTVDDKLGYAEYARAIYHFLRDPRTHPPLTISIQAPWGGGKTSLMRMIQREVDPEGYEKARPSPEAPAARGKGVNVADVLEELDAVSRDQQSPVQIDLRGGSFPTIWFNAWVYQSGKQIWAGLGEAIIRGLSERLDPVQREKFLLRLHLSRVDAHAVRAKLYQAATERFLGYLRGGLKWLVAGVAAAAAAGIATLAKSEDLTWVPPAVAASPFGWAFSGAAVSGVVTALAGYAKALAQAKQEPAKLTISDYLDVPDYGAELGFVHEVNRDLRRVLELLPSVQGPDGELRKAPIVLFIDDLDRCSPGKVAEVFEAINLFVAGEFPNCYVILGMDSEVVAAALEEAHKAVVSRLPAYSRQTGVGWRFMDKFVQLPFVIPPMSPAAVANYAEHLAARENLAASKAQARAAELAAPTRKQEVEGVIAEATAVEDPKERSRQVAEKLGLDADGERLAGEMIERSRRLQFIDRQAQQLTQDSGEIEKLLRGAYEEFSNNPRELKRLVNVYRFFMNLRLAREARGEPVPTRQQMRNWVMLSLAWPEVFRWLRRSHSEWETVQEEDEPAPLRARLERLEEMALASAETTVDTEGEIQEREPTLADWMRRLEELSGLAAEKTPWLGDERLFRFFQRVAGSGEEGSLAAGAGRGFW